METHLFLDLEETLVESWFRPIPLTGNINKIKEFIKERNLTKATLFSMAIFNQEEEDSFNRSLKPKLEELLNIDLDVVQMNTVFREIIKFQGIVAKENEWHELFIFNQKEQPFTEWIISKKAENTEFILFDDVVANKDIFLRDSNVKIIFNKV